MSIHIVQLLCPARHCVMGCAYDPSAGASKEEAIAGIELAREQLGINPWCMICHSRDLTYEDRATIFQTMVEAVPALAECQTKNLATRDWIVGKQGGEN